MIAVTSIQISIGKKVIVEGTCSAWDNSRKVRSSLVSNIPSKNKNSDLHPPPPRMNGWVGGDELCERNTKHEGRVVPLHTNLLSVRPHYQLAKVRRAARGSALTRKSPRPCESLQQRSKGNRRLSVKEDVVITRAKPSVSQSHSQHDV